MTSGELLAGALERAGGAALRDAMLDRLLADEASRRGVTISPADVEREHQRLLEELAGAAEADGPQTASLLDSLRRSRGLGPVTFESSLRRSALLRRLAEGAASATEADFAAAEQVEFGPRVRARVLVVPDREVASSLRSTLAMASPADARMAFAGASVEHSVDGSAGAGGLLARASPHDPGLAEPVREALRTQREGEVGPVLPLARGYALVLVESRTPGREPNADERAALRDRVRSRNERVAMESLAERLLADAKVTVLDRSLRWSWEGVSR